MTCVSLKASVADLGAEHGGLGISCAQSYPQKLLKSANQLWNQRLAADFSVFSAKSPGLSTKKPGLAALDSAMHSDLCTLRQEARSAHANAHAAQKNARASMQALVL